jgi:hypothetical protein
MFLPQELHDIVATLQVRDSAGAMHPLVRFDRVLFRATRPAEPTAPPNLAPRLSCIGLAIGLVLLAVGWRVFAAGVGLRAVAATLFALWSLVAGVLGTVIAFLWALTPHVFAHSNENLLLFNPLWLILVVLLPVAFTAHRAVRATRRLAVGLAALTVIALLAHLVRLSPQSNLAIIGLALPPAIAIAIVASRLRRSARIDPSIR